MGMACMICGKRAYSEYCVQHKPRKPITQHGKRAIAYETWRDEVAIPYLDSHFGHFCAWCNATENLDVDHIKTRGSRADLKMDVNNVRFLCRSCHQTRD